MPSVLLGLQSGGENLFSGGTWSGYNVEPLSAIVLRLDRTASGNVYVGLSGGVTITSGGFYLSGGGLLDGIPLYPGDVYEIPRLGAGLSGNPQVYFTSVAAASGQSRLCYYFY